MAKVLKNSREIDAAFKKLQKELEKKLERVAGGKHVKVGIPNSESNKYPSGADVYKVALTHEFGLGVAERPFLLPTFHENESELAKDLANASKNAINGDPIERQLDLLGLKWASKVKDKIDSIESPPITHREGSPLNLTNHMRNSVTWVLGED